MVEQLLDELNNECNIGKITVSMTLSVGIKKII